LLCPACLKWHRWGQKEALMYDRGELTKSSKPAAVRREAEEDWGR
jgi:hypothetical protein